MTEHNATPCDDERATLINLWERHGASFESHHTEGEELADAILAAPWESDTGCFGHCDPEGWAECTNRTNRTIGTEEGRND